MPTQMLLFAPFASNTLDELFYLWHAEPVIAFLTCGVSYVELKDGRQQFQVTFLDTASDCSEWKCIFSVVFWSGRLVCFSSCCLKNWKSCYILLIQSLASTLSFPGLPKPFFCWCRKTKIVCDFELKVVFLFLLFTHWRYFDLMRHNVETHLSALLRKIFFCLFFLPPSWHPHLSPVNLPIAESSGRLLLFYNVLISS